VDVVAVATLKIVIQEAVAKMAVLQALVVAINQITNNLIY